MGDDNKEMTLEGLSGGAKGSGYNADGNGKGKQQQQKKGRDIKEYFVYKYDRDLSLAEQIILDSKSVFLQIDRDGNPITFFKIDLIKQRGFMLSPHQDGVGGLASFTLPIRFKDHKEVKDFIEVAKHENIDSIFLQHKAIWEKFVVANEKETITFLAIDSVYSNFQDLFETTHCDLIDGAPGSGKGATLITFQLLGYRVVLAADLSGANILDLYGFNGRAQITVAEDELDDIEDDAIKRKMYKIGYDLTGKTTRTLDGNTSNRANRLYEIFGLKIFGTEIASDDKSLGGFNDRNFRIENTKGKPLFRVKKVLLEMEKSPEKQNPKYRQIVRQVEYVRKLTFIFRMIHHPDMIEEVETNIDGRPLELTGPQIYLFASKALGSAYASATTAEERSNSLLVKEILPTLTHFLRKKGQLTEKTIQSVVCDALKELFSDPPNELLIRNSDIVDVSTGKKRETIQVAYDLIYDKVKKLTDGRDPINPNEQAFYSVEYGKLTHRQILNICKNPFRGESGKIHAKEAQAKSMTFDKAIIESVGEGLKAIDKIEILDEPLPSTSGTEVLNSTLYREQGQNDDLEQQEQSETPTQKDEDIHTDDTQSMEESQDINDKDENNTDVQDSPIDGIDSEDKNIPLPRTAQNSVPQYPDIPSHEQTSRLLKNLQEAEQARKDIT